MKTEKAHHFARRERKKKKDENSGSKKRDRCSHDGAARQRTLSLLYMSSKRKKTAVKRESERHYFFFFFSFTGNTSQVCGERQCTKVIGVFERSLMFVEQDMCKIKKKRGLDQTRVRNTLKKKKRSKRRTAKRLLSGVEHISCSSPNQVLLRMN